MLIDYLRYLAFEGRLRPFFEEGLSNYAELSATTGQHLRFAPQFLEDHFGWRGQKIVHALYWPPHSEDLILERLKRDLGLVNSPHNFTAPQFEIGGTPPTFLYKELRPPGLEIIIDIDPTHWTDRYVEPRNYEDIRVIYRRAGPARADLRSGDKLLTSGRRRTASGTLCGVFSTANRPAVALTCGHVAAASNLDLFVEHRRQNWRLPLLHSNTRKLGTVRNITVPKQKAHAGGPVFAHLDAALIELDANHVSPAQPRLVREAIVKPITTVLQEEPVCFRGAGRVNNTLARVTAVTVRKSMNLFNDGKLFDVGDVLMLGHRHPMYVAQYLSRPGDSGAAVRQDFSPGEQDTEFNHWHGMILGGDETGAYATYAEHLWAWSAQQMRIRDLAFTFET